MSLSRRQMPTSNNFRASSIPPDMTPMDHAILQSNGVTTAIELNPRSLQACKYTPILNPTQQIEELTRENGRLRHEIQFLRRCSKIDYEFRDTVYQIYQQVYLIQAFHIFNQIPDVRERLEKGFNKYHDKADKARASWLAFYEIKNDAMQEGGGDIFFGC
ncbi:hypothetical protein BTUL_0321g00050 [Botrytis tulipae]|uniref:Uncharacterized protein n=1 Tax=Botrytis tulipae TaxID=87230 RepID=A0A4Z1E8Q2_9HELO|nr:hypothetical protein BTUL_0321g00050 [Botrytis tulipae]